MEKIFAKGPATNYTHLLRQGALVLDVRTKGEYEESHIKGAVNIPANQLVRNLAYLPDKKQILIVCCESEQRSASAKKILEDNGYGNVYDGGIWNQLANKL